MLTQEVTHREETPREEERQDSSSSGQSRQASLREPSSGERPVRCPQLPVSEFEEISSIAVSMEDNSDTEEGGW